MIYKVIDRTGREINGIEVLKNGYGQFDIYCDEHKVGDALEQQKLAKVLKTGKLIRLPKTITAV